MTKESFIDSINSIGEEIRNNWPEYKKSFGCLNNDNTFTKIGIKKHHPSSISLAHESLYKKQEEKQSWLTRKDLELVLQTISGICFKPGTDSDDVIRELKKYNYISEDKLKDGELRYFIRSAEWY